jgi:hypothetical protein
MKVTKDNIFVLRGGGEREREREMEVGDMLLAKHTENDS